MGIRNGQLRRLRNNHPELFRYLILKTGLGVEIMRIKSILNGASFTLDDNPENILI